MDTLQKLPFLESVMLNACGKKHDIEKAVLEKQVPHVSI
jgi:hypothetical protein